MRLPPPRSWRADSLRTNPSSAIAASTRWRVRSATTSGRLSTLETVPSETRACAATSFMLGEPATRASSRLAVIFTARLETCKPQGPSRIDPALMGDL